MLPTEKRGSAASNSDRPLVFAVGSGQTFTINVSHERSKQTAIDEAHKNMNTTSETVLNNKYLAETSNRESRDGGAAEGSQDDLVMPANAKSALQNGKLNKEEDLLRSCFQEEQDNKKYSS